MKFEIVFLRHGESTGNLAQEIHGKDIDFLLELTEKGKEQADVVKKILQDESFDSIFSSDMIRAKQTAKIIFGDTHDIHFDERLREYYISTDNDFMITYGQIPRPERIQLRLSGFTNGESFSHQVERIKSFMDMLLTGEYGHKIAVISHVGCLRTLECIYNNMSLEDALLLKQTDNCGIRRVYITKDQNGISFSEK